MTNVCHQLSAYILYFIMLLFISVASTTIFLLKQPFSFYVGFSVLFPLFIRLSNFSVYFYFELKTCLNQKKLKSVFLKFLCKLSMGKF